MPVLKVYNTQGKETESLTLPDNLFPEKINEAVIHQVAVMFLANQRQGTVSTKTRSDVAGSNRKPFKQKGTGRARQGSKRSPLNHGGGIVFGPHPRDFSYSVPKKIRQAALRECLNSKYQKEDICCLDQFVVDSGKTKDFIKVLSNLKITDKVLAVIDDSTDGTRLASRNIPYVKIARAQDINALDLLNNKKLLLTKASFEVLLKRLS